MTDVVKKLGTIEPLPSGRFRVRFSIGRRLKTVATVDTEPEAEAARATMARILLANGDQPAAVSTLAAFGLEVLDERELGREIVDTDTERSRWRSYVEGDPLGRVDARAVDDQDVREWLRRLLAKGLARSTRQNALNLLRAVMSSAIEKRLHPGPNPCTGLRLKAEKRTEEPWTYLSPEEQRALVRAMPGPLDALTEAAMGLGLRAGELVTLRLADVHLEGPDPHVVVRYGKPPSKPTKTGRIRRVPVFGHGLAALTRWIAGLASYCADNPHGLAFPGPTGAFRSPAHVIRWAVWRAALTKAGLTRAVRWHDLRHTCASSLVSGWWGRAWTLAEVKEMLGHASVTTTERYAHLADTVLKKAAREGAAVFHAASTVSEAPAEIASDVAGATLENRTRDLRFTKASRTTDPARVSEVAGNARGNAANLFLEAVAARADASTIAARACDLARTVADAREVVLALEILRSEGHAHAAALELAELAVAEAEASLAEVGS